MISADSQDSTKRKSGRVPITLPTTTTTTTTTTSTTTTTTTTTSTTTRRIVTTQSIYRSTVYSAQDRYGYSGVIDGDKIKVNRPILSDNIIDNTAGDLLGHNNDHIKPKTGARIRDDAHNFHQGWLLFVHENQSRKLILEFIFSDLCETDYRVSISYQNPTGYSTGRS